MPVRLTAVVAPVEELLAMISVPVAAPAVAGSTSISSVAICPAFRVTGNVAPDTEKPAPLRAAEETVTAALPVDVRVSDCVVGVFTFTSPKPTLAELTLRVEVAAFSCTAKFIEPPASVAVRVAVCEVLTDATAAVNVPMVAPAETVTEAGTVTELLLLARVTTTPPVGAAELSVAVQASLPDPVNVEVAQESALRVTVPVPLRLTTVDAPVEELLAKVNDPAAAPAKVGSNCTVRVADCAGFNVTGNDVPEIVNPAPLTVAELTVTGILPVEFKVTVWLTAVLST